MEGLMLKHDKVAFYADIHTLEDIDDLDRVC